jgi:Heparinase II/III-like protein/Domain of unknown function (DUF4962)
MYWCSKKRISQSFLFLLFISAVSCVFSGESPKVSTAPLDGPLVVTNERPHVLTTSQRIGVVKQRTAQVKALRDVVSTRKGFRPRDDNEMALMLINFGVARHVLNDKNYSNECEQLLALCCQYFDEKTGHLSKELLDEFELLHMLDGAAYGYDLAYHDLSPARREAVAGHLRRCGQWIAQDILLNEGWACTDFGNHKYKVLCTLTLIGSALAPEDPEGLRFLTVARDLFLKRIVPALDIIGGNDGGWSEGIAYNRIAATYLMNALDALEHGTGLSYWRTSKWFSHNGYYIIYNLLPNGRYQGLGDMFSDRPYWGDRVLLARYAEIFSVPQFAFGADYVRTLATYQDEPLAVGIDLLSVDSQATKQDYTNLPTARQFTGTGLHIFRDGWDQDATMVTFRCGPQLSSHQHADQNSFTIFNNGYLAIDSGAYDDFWSKHSFSYYRRSIAHNTVVVFDNKEKLDMHNTNNRLKKLGILPLSNDGGQYHFNIVPTDIAEYEQHKATLTAAKTTVFTTTKHYDFCRGEAGDSYVKPKMQGFRRDFMFIHRRSASGHGIIVTADYVDVANKNNPVRWLLHTIDKPLAESWGAMIREGNGELALLTSPGQTRNDMIGGTGAEFMVDGKNMAPQSRRPLGAPEGSWRIEVSPLTQTSNRIELLNVMLVGKGAQAAASQVVISQNNGIRVIRDGSAAPAQFIVLGINNPFIAILPSVGKNGQMQQMELHDVVTGKTTTPQVTLGADGSATVSCDSAGPFLVRLLP